MKTIKIKPARIEIKPSKKIKGEVGVFALNTISKGTVVVDSTQFENEKFIKWSQFKKLDSITQKKILDYCSGRIDGVFVPDDLNYISIAWHINHSCDPNLGFDSKYNFVAMKDIKSGSELFWDYGFDEMNPDFKLKCFCGAKSCRKTITGNDWKNSSFVKNNFKYISPDMKDYIETLK